jgi:hypothetical protein
MRQKYSKMLVYFISTLSVLLAVIFALTRSS